jgi:hypothetical protein
MTAENSWRSEKKNSSLGRTLSARLSKGGRPCASFTGKHRSGCGNRAGISTNGDGRFDVRALQKRLRVENSNLNLRPGSRRGAFEFAAATQRFGTRAKFSPGGAHPILPATAFQRFNVCGLGTRPPGVHYSEVPRTRRQEGAEVPFVLNSRNLFRKSDFLLHRPGSSRSAAKHSRPSKFCQRFRPACAQLGWRAISNTAPKSIPC